MTYIIVAGAMVVSVVVSYVVTDGIERRGNRKP